MLEPKLSPNFRFISCQHEEWTGQQDEHFLFEDLIPEDMAPAWDIVDAIGFVTWGQNEKHILSEDIIFYSEKFGILTDSEITNSPILAQAMISLLRHLGTPQIYVSEKLEKNFSLVQDRRRSYQYLLRPNALLGAVGAERTNDTNIVHNKSVLVVNAGTGTGHAQLSQATACFEDWKILQKIFNQVYPVSGDAARLHWPELDTHNFLF